MPSLRTNESISIPVNPGRNLPDYFRCFNTGSIKGDDKKIIRSSEFASFLEFFNVPEESVLILGAGRNLVAGELEKKYSKTKFFSFDLLYTRASVNNIIAINISGQDSSLEDAKLPKQAYQPVEQSSNMVGGDWNKLSNYFPENNFMRIMSNVSFPFWAQSPEEISNVVRQISHCSKNKCEWWLTGPRNQEDEGIFLESLSEYGWEKIEDGELPRKIVIAEGQVYRPFIGKFVLINK